MPHPDQSGHNPELQEVQANLLRWFKEAQPEKLIRNYLEKQREIFSAAYGSNQEYAPTADPRTRELCEMTICEVTRSLVPAPEGFKPVTNQKATLYDQDGRRIGQVNHMFYYNKSADLIMCLAPAQFVDQLFNIPPDSKIAGKKGNRIKILREMASRSSIRFINSPNERGNYIMVGNPDEIKRVLGIDYFGR